MSPTRHVARKGNNSTRSSSTKIEEPSRPRRRRVSKTKRATSNVAPLTTQTIILAMSPATANILRTLINKARVGEDEGGRQLKALSTEIESQLHKNNR